MASSVTVSSISQALKRVYKDSEESMPKMAFRDDPVMAMIKKDTTWGGEKTVFPIMYAEHQGVSATFTDAQAVGQDSNSVMQIKQWQIDTANARKIYGAVQIDGAALAALTNGGSAKSYLAKLKAHSDSIIRGIGRRLAIQMWRTGWGEIGRVNNSSYATTGLQLTIPYDARNFEYGLQFAAGPDLSSSALRNSGATLRVVGVDLDADLGTAQVTTNVNLSTGIAAIAQNDYLFPRGDRDPSASPVQKCITGFETWCPFDRSTIGTLFNVDRTAHKQRLAGNYLNASALPIKEAVETLIGTVSDRGGDPDIVVMSNDKMVALKKELGSKVEYNEVKAPDLEVGFKGIVFLSSKNRPVTAVVSQGIPTNRFAVMQTNTWRLLSMGGDPVRFLDEDGLQISRISNDDAYEMRIGGYLELVCQAPGWNGHGSFDGV